MIKTAIIGASGFIGNHLLKAYQTHYPDVIGTTFSKLKNGLTYFDLKNPKVEDLNLVETQHKAVIIASANANIAWCENNQQESYALNVKGTLDLVQQLENLGLYTIFLSSDYVFDGLQGNYIDTSEPNPTTTYGKHKALVEREIPNITKNYSILRLSKIYGTTFQDNTLLDNLAHDLLDNKRLQLAQDQYFSPTHVNDIVKMTLYLQEQDAKGIINACHPTAYSRYEIGLELVKAFNLPPELIRPCKLHDFKGMEDRPLNTSLSFSTILKPLQRSLISITDSINSIKKIYMKYLLKNSYECI